MPGTTLIVFRDGSRQVPAESFARELLASIHSIKSGCAEAVVDALIMAGQLEAALWDREWPTAGKWSELTDTLASLFAGNGYTHIDRTLSEMPAALPDFIRISEPEGFAYYALHPGDFADIVKEIQRSSVAVVGIRSIGTTLSAVAAAQFQKQGIAAHRITVRPCGHPYDRKTQFTPSQQRWIDEQNRRGSTFLVTDEGPGLSGSSFLSVGESLTQLGVASDRILMIGTRETNPDGLCADNAGARWRQFGWRQVPSRIYARYRDLISLSGGVWRDVLLGHDSNWPACWTQMESLKFLSVDRKNIFKFEGFGRIGRNARERARALHDAGLGPSLRDMQDGMLQYDFVSGKPSVSSDLSCDLLDRIAIYCAFRASEFRAPECNGSELQKLAEFNYFQETGRTLHLPVGCFATDAAIYVDARMQPHEWIQAQNGVAFKIDATRHADDHFLPGPTDIAWDLAGAIVEWNMGRDAVQSLIGSFGRFTGKSIEPGRLSCFLLAYAIFRSSFCKMALAATQDAAEQARLERACNFYRAKAVAAAARVSHDPEMLIA